MTRSPIGSGPADRLAMPRDENDKSNEGVREKIAKFRREVGHITAGRTHGEQLWVSSEQRRDHQTLTGLTVGDLLDIAAILALHPLPSVRGGDCSASETQSDASCAPVTEAAAGLEWSADLARGVRMIAKHASGTVSLLGELLSFEDLLNIAARELEPIPEAAAGLDLAWRAVDACGGTYSAAETASGYAAGHSEALTAACAEIGKLGGRPS